MVRTPLVLCLWLGTACSEPEAPPATTPGPEALSAPQRTGSAPPAAGILAEPPTVILITIDTLRREHLGCYGYFRDTTPTLDALAKESLVFDRALASMASTLPSHLTMLTGLYPHQHGMSSNRRGAKTSYNSELGRLSMAEVLRQCGYRTAGFVSAAPLSPTTGIGVGFETYSCPRNSPMGSSIRAGERNEEVLAWLDEQAGQAGPFFLWVHYFDPHEPNDPVPPYDSMFQTDSEQLEWIARRHIDPARLTERYGKSKNIQRQFLELAPAAQRKAQRAGVEITLDTVADLMNRYDGETRYNDDRVAELLDALRRHGRYEDSILIVVADHGQSLGENRWLGHGTISDVNTFVPLILRLPGGLIAPQRIEALVSLTDLMPTVFARFELPGSELFRGQFEGQDVLSGAFLRDAVLATRTADKTNDGETGRQFALHSGPWKYIFRPEGQDELYDGTGSGEYVDVLVEHPQVAKQLRDAAIDILARRPALLQESDSVDEELLRSLEALGYGGEGDE